MPVTNFPGGINAGDAHGAAGALQVGGTAYLPVSASTAGVKVGSLAGTAITGAGTIAASAFGLTAVTAAVGGLGGTVLAWEGTAAGKAAFVKTHVAGGAVVVGVFDATGAAASAAGTVAIVAYGT